MNNFNARILLENLMEDHDLAHDILQIYIESTKDLLEELERAITENDTQRAGLHAHSLKGSSSNVGAEKICRMAAKAESLAKNDELPKIAELLPDIKSGYQDFLVAARRDGWVD